MGVLFGLGIAYAVPVLFLPTVYGLFISGNG